MSSCDMILLYNFYLNSSNILNIITTLHISSFTIKSSAILPASLSFVYKSTFVNLISIKYK